MGGQGVVGVDATRSHLWCQVKRGKPEMKIDSDNRLRHMNWPDSASTVFLGDISDALLRCFGAHEPPIFTQPPGFDQQKWTMVVKDSTMRVEVKSRSYWGFGLFDSCFLNELIIDGPLERRARFIFDLVASLGRNPWEPFVGIMWRRATKASGGQHLDAWKGLVKYAHEQMDEEAHKYVQLVGELESKFDEFSENEFKNWDLSAAKDSVDEAKKQIEIARNALHDKNAAGFERALARAEAALIEADPTTEVTRTPFQEADDLLLESALEIEEEMLEEKILVLEELPEEVERITPIEVGTSTADVTADDLLDGLDDEPMDEVPFVDLTESE